MGFTQFLLVHSLVFTVGYSIDAPPNCGMLTDDPTLFNNVTFSQTDRTGNILRFCQERAEEIRREHFWCHGYIDEDNSEIAGSTNAPLPVDDPTDDFEPFWSIFLQFPALSWMDVARKGLIMMFIEMLVRFDPTCGNVNLYGNFCISDVETSDVAEYSESVLVTLYNLGNGLSGDDFNLCFRNGLLDDANSDIVVRFRSRRAFNLTLDGMDLLDMFSQNIGPASSIGNENEDPTLRAIVLGSWPGDLTIDQARDRTSSGAFGSNPDPINYGLEAGDVVFAFFGSILLVVLGALVLLGYFIHPFFLS